MRECYAYKNRSGYNILSLVIDYDDHTVTLYRGCNAPINKYKKATKKYIEHLFNAYHSSQNFKIEEK